MAQVTDLRNRTPGEQIWMVRHALGLTQALMAKHLGICLSFYNEAENDKRVIAFPRFRYTLTSWHYLMLARRRYGKGLWGTARAVGVSHRTLLFWERTADARLLAFYRGKFTGFTFN